LSDKIIEVSNEEERRKWQRRREDQALVRERRYEVLRAAARLMAGAMTRHSAPASPGYYVEQALDLLANVESREQEREKEKE
jgi:hypothetical protein